VPLALIALYGLAGLGVAAFTPSALSLVADAALRDKTGHACAWYATAHYGALGIGPYVGGLVAEWWGYRPALLVSGLGIAFALGLGLALRVPPVDHASSRSSATFADIKGNAAVWAGWIVSVSGLLIQGVVFPFFPSSVRNVGLDPRPSVSYSSCSAWPTRLHGCRPAGCLTGPGGPRSMRSSGSCSHLR